MTLKEIIALVELIRIFSFFVNMYGLHIKKKNKISFPDIIVTINCEIDMVVLGLEFCVLFNLIGVTFFLNDL